MDNPTPAEQLTSENAPELHGDNTQNSPTAEGPELHGDNTQNSPTAEGPELHGDTTAASPTAEAAGSTEGKSFPLSD